GCSLPVKRARTHGRHLRLHTRVHVGGGLTMKRIVSTVVAVFGFVCGTSHYAMAQQVWEPEPSNIFWQNTQTTEVSIWQMNNGAIGAYLYPQSSVPAAWVVRGTGDFNGDGIGDILWQNTQTTEVSIWQMTSSGTIGAYLYPQAGVPAAWVVRGTGDFNGDGTTDIF